MKTLAIIITIVSLVAVIPSAFLGFSLGGVCSSGHDRCDRAMGIIMILLTLLHCAIPVGEMLLLRTGRIPALIVLLVIGTISLVISALACIFLPETLSAACRP